VVCCALVVAYVVYLAFKMRAQSDLLASLPINDTCSCANSTYHGLVWYRTAWDPAPEVNIVNGLHETCCVLPRNCVAKAAGVIADGTDNANSQWNVRWSGHDNQLWAVLGYERPESADRVYSHQDTLDRFGAHYTMTSMVDSDFPVEWRAPSYFVDKFSPICTNSTRPGSVFYLASNCATVWGDWTKGLEALLCYYRFQLIVTNAICDDYVDEKLGEALQRGVIPIYLGMSNVDQYDPGLLRGVHRAIISVLDFESFEDVASHVNHLLSNGSAYNEYFQFRNVTTPEIARIPRREIDRKDLGPYFNSSLPGMSLHMSWFCDRIANKTRPRAKVSTHCHQKWHEFMRTKGKQGFVDAFERSKHR